MPQGWGRSTRDGRVYFREPAGRRYLMVDQTRTPKADPVADWRAQESAVRNRLPGYQRITIRPVDFRGWRAADWEFRWQAGGGPLHVINRNVITATDRAYALYFSVPDSAWVESQPLFESLMASFQPAGLPSP